MRRNSVHAAKMDAFFGIVHCYPYIIIVVEASKYHDKGGKSPLLQSQLKYQNRRLEGSGSMPSRSRHYAASSNPTYKHRKADCPTPASKH